MLRTFFFKRYEIENYDELGIYEALDVVSAIEYMFEAVDHGKRVIGGDIVEFKDGGYYLSYNNWSSSKDKTPQQTLEDALNYLRKYLSYNLKNYSFKVCVSIESDD